MNRSNSIPSLRLFVRGAAIALILAGAGMRAPAAVILQQSGDDFIAFQAEDADTIENSDAANDVQNSATTGSAESPARLWTVVADGSALDGSALEAPPSPHRQQTAGGPQESVAVFQLRFLTSGTYRIYLRARNNGTAGNGSSDSLWLPASFGNVVPDVNRSISNAGTYEWVTGISTTYTVSAGDIGNNLEFRIGVRENDLRLDALVVSLQSTLTSTDLDDLFGGTPQPSGCVTTVGALAAAHPAATPGTTICMQDGIWNASDIVFDGRLSSNGTGGTSGSPITLQAQTQGMVQLTGGTRLRIAGQYMTVDGLRFEGATQSGSNESIVEFRNGSGASDRASHCRLTNTSMIDCNPVSATTNYKWVSVYGLDNRVDHCYFSGMNHEGVQLTVWLRAGDPTNNTQIDYNYFGDRTEGTGNGFETIRIGTSDTSTIDSGALVENNYFVRCDGEIEIISNKSIGNTYRYNTFVDCKGQLTLRHGEACLVQGNFFIGNNKSGASGVRIIGPDHTVINNYFEGLNGTGSRAALAMMNGVPSSPLDRYLAVENALVAFNTFVNCAQVFNIGVEASEGDTTIPPDNCVIANNVVRSSGSTAIITYTNTPTNFTYEGDIFSGSNLGITAPSGVSTANPLLVVAADGLYRPDTGSPAIDGAIGSYPSITDDMDGDARDDATKDAGADEVRVSTPVRRPLTPSDVGPVSVVPIELSGFYLD